MKVFGVLAGVILSLNSAFAGSYPAERWKTEAEMDSVSWQYSGLGTGFYKKAIQDYDPRLMMSYAGLHNCLSYGDTDPNRYLSIPIQDEGSVTVSLRRSVDRKSLIGTISVFLLAETRVLLTTPIRAGFNDDFRRAKRSRSWRENFTRNCGDEFVSVANHGFEMKIEYVHRINEKDATPVFGEYAAKMGHVRVTDYNAKLQELQQILAGYSFFEVRSSFPYFSHYNPYGDPETDPAKRMKNFVGAAKIAISGGDHGSAYEFGMASWDVHFPFKKRRK